MTIRAILKKVTGAFRVSLLLLFGAFAWMIASMGAGWIASPLGRGPSLVAMWSWLALYALVIVSTFRSWATSHRLAHLTEAQRVDYFGTAMILPYTLLSVLAIICAFVIWGWQILFWLRTSEWASLDIVTLQTPGFLSPRGPQVLFLTAFPPQPHGWLVSPKDWLGLHRIISFVFSWVTPSLILTGLAVAGFNEVGNLERVKGDLERESRRLSKLDAQQGVAAEKPAVRSLSEP